MSETFAMFALGCLAFLALLTILAAVADWWNGRERRDSRRRNRHVR